MKYETYEKAEKLLERASELERQKRYLNDAKDSKYLRLYDGVNWMQLKEIDPSGELGKTVLCIVEAKLAEAIKKVNEEFEALKDD